MLQTSIQVDLHCFQTTSYSFMMQCLTKTSSSHTINFSCCDIHMEPSALASMSQPDVVWTSFSPSSEETLHYADFWVLTNIPKVSIKVGLHVKDELEAVYERSPSASTRTVLLPLWYSRVWLATWRLIQWGFDKYLFQMSTWFQYCSESNITHIRKNLMAQLCTFCWSEQWDEWMRVTTQWKWP